MIELVIAQVQNGLASRYVDIVQIYQQPIYRYCLRLLGNPQDAEDAAQDIFTKAFASIRQYKARIGFSSWLYKIAHHHCLNLLRARKRRLRLLTRLVQPDAEESPEQAMDKTLFSPQLSFALRTLSSEERSLLILRVFEERSYEELGDIIGCKPEAAKKRFNRTKEKVKRQMKQWQEEKHLWNEEKQAIQ